jgi:glucuronosyltransferase
LTASQTAKAPLFRVLWVNSKPLDRRVLSSLPTNVRVEQWVAQYSILAHPAVSVFITHSGSSSLQEAISVGLPLLAMPLFGDQMSNAAKLFDHGVAQIINSPTLTSEDVCTKLRLLVFDAEVRLSVDRMQQLYHTSRGMEEQAAVVIEQTAINSDHLIPYRNRRDVSWIIRYNVDVFAVGAVIAVLSILLLAVTARLVVTAAMRALRRQQKWKNS